MNETYLAHHGIKGMKWGIRKYQNEDGTLTSRGLKRYTSQPGKDQIKKPGARRYLADQSYYSVRKNKKYNRNQRSLAALSGATLGIGAGLMAKTQGRSDREALILGLGGTVVGYGINRMAARGGEWLGSRFGSALADQKYVDIVDQQIRSGGKVDSLDELYKR